MQKQYHIWLCRAAGAVLKEIVEDLEWPGAGVEVALAADARRAVTLVAAGHTGEMKVQPHVPWPESEPAYLAYLADNSLVTVQRCIWGVLSKVCLCVGVVRGMPATRNKRQL